MQVAISKKSYLNDPHCGDECAYWQSGVEITLCVIDGLGHGAGAEKAAQAAVNYVAQHLQNSLSDIFAGCNLAIRKTRGVVMGIAVVDESAGTLTYAGVGNPRAMIVRARRPASVRENVIRLPSSSGIVGSGYRRLSPDTIPLNPGDLVILYTDGIPGAMDISGYGEALSGNVHWLAEKIIQDWGRKADDAAILVFRSEGT